MVRTWQRPAGTQFRFGPPLSQTIKALLTINVLIFLFQQALSAPEQMSFWRSFGLMPASAIPRVHLWQFGTYMFLHGGFMHLLFNMFALWMFGSEIASLWGRRTFLSYYFFCGLGGGLTYTFTSWGSEIPLVGASGAIFGILLAYGLMFPDRQILLYFLFPIKAKYFVLLFGLLELMAAGQGHQSGIGHFAHLGGMLFGFLYLKGGMLALDGGVSWRSVQAAWRRQRTKSKMRVVRPPEPRPFSKDEQEKVDAILEKISREGLNSLTTEEQDILRRASRKH